MTDPSARQALRVFGFAYPLLLILQMKVAWDMWRSRDLTGGDESSYYSIAHLWFTKYAVSIAWSPLYTAFFGTVMHVSPHAYIAGILHRLFVVLLLAMLVLALMRRLLPPGLAWFAAAWWVILPINFDTAYTIHLFTVIPVLVSWLLLLTWRSPWAHGASMATMLLTAALVRNEYVVALVLLIAICAWWSVRVEGRRLRQLVVPYGVPLLLACVVVLGAYARSVYQYGNGLEHIFRQKHTVNMCQVYAAGFQQRHPTEWTKSIWTECPGLMQLTFGEPEPSLSAMIRRNPRAVLVHFLWNLSLVPAGFQLLLFNEAAGRTNPDYAPATLGSTRALVLSGLLLAVTVAGLALLYSRRDEWWHSWMKDRALGWLGMLTTIPVGVLVILTQRPRPSYLFAQGVIVMALVGMSVFVILDRLPWLRRAPALGLVGAVALVVLVPCRYHTYGIERPLLEVYERLLPFSSEFHDRIFMVDRAPMEIHGYVSHNYFTNPFLNLDYVALPAGEDINRALAARSVTLLYVSEPAWEKLRPCDLVGWRTLIWQQSHRGQWGLFCLGKACRRTVDHAIPTCG